MRTVTDTIYAYKKWISLELQTALGAGNRTRSARHLVLFAWSLPPSTWAGVYRPLSFLEYSAQANWRVTAFGGEVTEEDRIGGEELLARVPRSSTVHRLSRTQRVPSWSLFPRTNGGFLDAIEFARESIRSLQTDPPSAVLATGPTFEMFIAAAFVAKYFRAPLVLDYRDEWTECPFTFVRLGKDDRRWERRCLAQADRVLFTTESQLRHHLTAFSELTRAKAMVLPNGWNPEEFRGETEGAHRSKEALLHIALVGNLADHAPPDSFLEAFGRLLEEHPAWRKQVVIYFIGRKSREAKARLDAFPFAANISAVDHLSKTQAVREMQRADALLLIARPELERYLPGKLFDYLAARRPVLVHGAPGEAANLVEELGAGFFCPDGDHERLLQILTELRDGEAGPSKCAPQWLEEHRRDVLAGKLYELLDELQERLPARTGRSVVSSERRG